MTPFNFFEIKADSRNNTEGIIVLTFALSKKYNTIISLDGYSIVKNLHINFLPALLYQKQYIVKTSKGVLNKYYTREPQSYFIASDWLYEKAPTIEKLIYLYALSQRAINVTDIFIPDNYIERKYWHISRFLKHKNNRIWFVPELNLVTKKLNQRRNNGILG